MNICIHGQAVKRRYYVRVYVGHFWPSDFGPISVRSLLYTPRSRFLRQYLSSVFHRRLTLFVATESARVVRERGRGGRGHAGGEKSFADVRAKLFLRAIYSVPVLQGNGEASSADHAEVRPRNRDCDPSINPVLHVRNGFVNFCCHELTQIREYDQGLLSKYAINR